jgi:ubiquinone biosynthesis protein UbiJ
MAAAHPVVAGAFGAGLEAALNHYLALDPRSRDLLSPLAGKIIALRLRPFGVLLYLCPTETGIQVLTELSGEPDAILSGTLAAFAKLGLGGRARDSLAPGEIEIEGDSETAGHFQTLFERLQIDWQSHFAWLTGQGFAAVLADAFRAGTAWTRNAVGSLRQDLAEYWQEETRELPSRPETEAFYREVERLREDFDRLETRVRRLETAAGS